MLYVFTTISSNSSEVQEREDNKKGQNFLLAVSNGCVDQVVFDLVNKSFVVALVEKQLIILTGVPFLLDKNLYSGSRRHWIGDSHPQCFILYSSKGLLLKPSASCVIGISMSVLIHTSFLLRHAIHVFDFLDRPFVKALSPRGFCMRNTSVRVSLVWKYMCLLVSLP